MFASPASYDALTGALLATGDYSRKLNHRFFQLGLSSKPAAWRELPTGVSRDKLEAARSVVGDLLDRVSASDAPVGEQLATIPSWWLADQEAQGAYTWRTYFVKCPAMREGESGRYVGWGGKLGYLVCMLRGERVSGYYRDPYLLAIHRLAGVGEAVTDPWFSGYEDNPRWLNLGRSGAGLAVLVVGSGAVLAGEQPLVEVITTSGLPIITDLKGDRIQVYEIDGIKRFEAELSRGLPADADAARYVALERVGQLDEAQMQRVQRGAMGLSKAIQYGIDRYPAIVFAGQAVVYGSTDLTEAFQKYRRWQEASGQ